jgi:hypothetical protein
MHAPTTRCAPAQELSEYLGLVKLNERLAEPSLQEYFTGIFPQDTMQNMRFSINFFTSIGLGGITDRQREMYKQVGAAAGHGSLVPVCISTKLLSACNMGVVCVVDLGAAAHASKAETQRAGRELVRAMLCMIPATTGRGTHH